MGKKAYEESKIRAIADKIREKTGIIRSYKVSEMTDGIEYVFNVGKNSMVDKEKIIEASAVGKGSITLNEISEIPHDITATVILRAPKTYYAQSLYFEWEAPSPYDQISPITSIDKENNKIYFTYTIRYTEGGAFKGYIEVMDDFNWDDLENAQGVKTRYEYGRPSIFEIFYPVCNLNVVDSNGNSVSYTPNAEGIVKNIASCSPVMTFVADNPDAQITVNYYKSWGMQMGYKIVYDRLQNFGKPQNYYSAFAYDRFDDTNFFPIYPIKCSSGTTPGRYIFYNSAKLTDTKVEIVANNNNIDYAFFGCSGLVTVPLLTVEESTNFNNTFVGCAELVNIFFGGTIGNNISFKDSAKLSYDSIDSIIEHLKDLTGDSSKTLTVHQTVYNKMVASGRDALVSAKNWTLVKA